MATASPLPQIPLVLDTNVFQAWTDQEESVKRNISEYERFHKRFPALTSITVYEVLVGFENTIAQRGGTDERTERGCDEALRLIQLSGMLPSGPSPSGVLPFDGTAATIAAFIAGQLFKQVAKRKTGASFLRDVFQVAAALAHHHGVATRNEKDFELIGEHLPATHPLLHLALWKR
jgi:predicted nucleic acid-binding protein